MSVTSLAVAARSRIVEILVEAAHPTKIILFGSHARGGSRVDSDVDLVVVEREVPSRYEEMVRLTRARTPLRMPIAALVYSDADVAEKGEWLGIALRSALLEGEPPYDSNVGLGALSRFCYRFPVIFVISSSVSWPTSIARVV